jgi:methionine-rich copper-binding protein CopC
VTVVAAVVAAAVAATGPAAAHGETILQLGAERIQPGGQVEVRGDLGAGEAFEVALISKADGSRRLIATIAATEEGHFQSYVTIPADLATGDYLVEVAVDLTAARAPLAIVGAPQTGGEEPDQGDGLAQPMPTVGPVAAGASVPVVPSEAGAARVAAAQIDGVVVGVAVAVLAIGILAGLRVLGRRARRPETDPDLAG